MTDGATALSVRALTPELWPALEDLFGEKGAYNGCCCMYWRIGGAYRRRAPEENKAAFREVVMRGPPPGLLAFDGDGAVGWCQLTPRDAVPWLERTWRLGRVDDVPVWSLSCFYVRKGHRRRGVTSALIAAALQAAGRAGAPALGGLSPGSRRDEQRVWYRLRHDVPPRRLPDGRPAHPASPHRAPRPGDGRAGMTRASVVRSRTGGSSSARIGASRCDRGDSSEKGGTRGSTS